MLTNLTKIDSDFINSKNHVHFKELQNNINHAVEISDSYREILSDQLNIYHTTVSTKLNDIMKFLTVFSVVFIPLTFIGFHPSDIVLIYSITQTYGILLHTQYIRRMPQWFEAIFVSPSHHRVHHGSNLIYLDKNMGMCLIIWDKLFGTFQPELEEEKVTYGLTSNINTFNPIKIAFLEWTAVFKDAINAKTSFGNKLNYFIKPPGWKHDGTGKLSNDLRQEWLKRKIK